MDQNTAIIVQAKINKIVNDAFKNDPDLCHLSIESYRGKYTIDKLDCKLTIIDKSITPRAVNGMELNDLSVSLGKASAGTKINYAGVVYTVISRKTKKYLASRDFDGARFNVPFIGSILHVPINKSGVGVKVIPNLALNAPVVSSTDDDDFDDDH